MESLINRVNGKSISPEIQKGDIINLKGLSRRERKGLAVINSHPGKRIVFETYMNFDPEKARKYLIFISNHLDARYIRWDIFRQNFVNAS